MPKCYKHLLRLRQVYLVALEKQVCSLSQRNSNESANDVSYLPT